MKDARWAVVGAVLAVLLAGLPAARSAWADDESDEVEIKIRAPLGDVHCETVPPTITVLGTLIIDITSAAIRANDEDEAPLDCAALVPLMGQIIKVELLNDVDVPPKATEVEVGGGDEEDDEVGEGGDGPRVEVLAPLQQVVVDTTMVHVLGLVIDASHADIEGSDDDDEDGEQPPVDLTTLPIGTFLEIRLDPALLPTLLVATKVEVKNSSNHVDVEVVGPDGQEIDDRDAAGNPVNDVEVRVAETVRVRRAGRRHARRMARVLHFHTRSNGSVLLSGLPTGHGRVSVTRTVNGSTMTGQGRVVVAPNGTRHRRIVLHHAG